MKKTLFQYSSPSNCQLRIQQNEALKKVTEVKLHLLKLCTELHKELQMNFDYSYSFEKDKLWVRTPNVLNINNDTLRKLESTKRTQYIHKRKEVELEPDQIMHSDILPQSKAQLSEKIKKTVNIECQGKLIRHKVFYHFYRC